MPQAVPTPGAQRLDLLDALRGFALAGVLLVNLRDLSLFGFLSEEARIALATSRWDHFLEIGIAALVEKKAITIFTLLFGIGFAMQAQRAAESGEGLHRYVRRLLILLAIGIGHSVFWYGDILRFYAVMGLVLVPMARLRTRALVWLGLAISLFSWPLLRPLGDSLGQGAARPNEILASTFAAFSDSSMLGMLKANLSYDLWSRVNQWNLPFALLGRFLIGAAFGRSDVVRGAQTHPRFWARLLVLSLPLGAALTTFGTLHDYGALRSRDWWNTELLIRPVQGAASLSLGLAYMAAFVLLFQRPAWHRWLNLLSPVGRMALTNYLLQTLIGLALFYGIGLGLGPRFGLAGVSFLFFPIIFCAQIAFSHWWLSRFNFGPIEWIWRCLTYGCRLPMRQRRTIPFTE